VSSLLDFDWRLPNGVRAVFTTRQGGVSESPWDSFNLGAHVGDAEQAVAANRAQLRKLSGLASEPAWLNQVHGTVVANLDATRPVAAPFTADAAVTRSVGVACVIMVADCLPVLFASRDGRRIGAAHAGWRGLASGVLENTVAALGVPAIELTAWLGPAISPRHFEVGAEVREAFTTGDAGAAEHFTPNSRGRWQANLAALARRRLGTLGVTDVHGGTWCTFADRERFFSHRRDSRGGRMAALIWKHQSSMLGSPSS
jgi:polyphenol oxidase